MSAGFLQCHTYFEKMSLCLCQTAQMIGLDLFVEKRG